MFADILNLFITNLKKNTLQLKKNVFEVAKSKMHFLTKKQFFKFK